MMTQNRSKFAMVYLFQQDAKTSFNTGNKKWTDFKKKYCA